ncbi:MAG: hypothetical protein JXR25_08630, partial [Pontiellaceae bacterium]|nr:hypothetical protein [Pontiellaceae bacterium]
MNDDDQSQGFEIRAWDIVCDALEVEPVSERNHFLESACAGDESLLAEVRELLDSTVAAEEYFQEGCTTRLGTKEWAGTLFSDPTFLEASHAILPPERELGQCIGPYRLLKK